MVTSVAVISPLTDGSAVVMVVDAVAVVAAAVVEVAAAVVVRRCKRIARI